MSGKKNLNKIIKDSINMNPEWGEVYNDLSNSEKEKMKNDMLDSLNLTDEFRVAHNLRWKYLQDIAIFHFESVLHGRGYKKLYGKKARAFAHSRVFICEYKDYTLCLKIKVLKKQCQYNLIALIKVKTDKGFCYGLLRGDEFAIDEEPLSKLPRFFTAHFFDRYQDRLGLGCGREDAIEHFLKNLTKASSAGITIENGVKVTMYLENGLGLGDFPGMLFLFKTFITHDLKNNYQKNLEKEWEERANEN